MPKQPSEQDVREALYLVCQIISAPEGSGLQDERRRLVIRTIAEAHISIEWKQGLMRSPVIREDDKMDTTNKFLVGVQGDSVIVGLAMQTTRISPEDAFNLAAWLVVMAETTALLQGDALLRRKKFQDFQDLVDKIKSS